MPENQYVYLEQDGRTACLRNGDDSILLNTTNPARLLNDLMAIFE